MSATGLAPAQNGHLLGLRITWLLVSRTSARQVLTCPRPGGVERRGGTHAARFVAVQSVGHGAKVALGAEMGRGGGKPRPPRSRYALRLESLQRATAPLTGICRQQRSPLCSLCPFHQIRGALRSDQPPDSGTREAAVVLHAQAVCGPMKVFTPCVLGSQAAHKQAALVSSWL